MLSSVIGGTSNIGKLIEMLSNADELKSILEEIQDRERVVEQATEQLFKGRSAQEFHDKLTQSMTQTRAEIDDYRDRIQRADVELKAQEHAIKTRLNAREEELNVERKQLELFKGDLDRSLASIQQEKSSNAELTKQLDMELTEARAMKKEYETKLAEFENTLLSLKTGS